MSFSRLHWEALQCNLFTESAYVANLQFLIFKLTETLTCLCICDEQVHLYGTSLGGFLAQLFAQHRPRRVRSLVLSNTYTETSSFKAAMPWAPMYVSYEVNVLE